MSSKVIREKRPLVTTVEARSPLQLFEPASRSTPGGGQEEVIEEEMVLLAGPLEHDEHPPVLALPDAGLVADLVGPRGFYDGTYDLSDSLVRQARSSDSRSDRRCLCISPAADMDNGVG